MQAKDSGRYKVANCTQAQPVFYGFAGLPDGKVILVSVLSPPAGQNSLPPAPAKPPPSKTREDGLYEHSRFPGCGGPDPDVEVQHAATCSTIVDPEPILGP